MTTSAQPFSINASGPARNRQAIAFCCDGNYMPFALHAAHQIAKLSPERDFDICIVDTEMPQIPASLADDDIRACQLNTGGLFQDSHGDKRRTASAYFRICLPQALQSDYDRILYLDADIFVQGGDFSALLQADLGGRPVGAVRDNCQWRNPNTQAPDFRAHNLAKAFYFNSGVLLIDVPTWTEQDITEKCVAFFQANSDRLSKLDQTVLNCVLHRNWAEMPPVWNWQYSVKSRLFEAMVTANIVHFIGPTKPWNAAPGRLPPRFGAELFAFLDEYLPDHGHARPVLAGPDLASRPVRDMLILHLWEHRATARYLAHFPDQLTVRP